MYAEVRPLALDTKKLSDFELIKQCLNGGYASDLCFEELVVRYKNLIYSVVLRMTNDREEANDLAQDIFVKIYKNIDKYYPEFKFSTWVIHIATNHVIDYRRKKRHELVPLDSISEVEGICSVPANSPEIAYLRKEQTEKLTQVINDLPDMYKIPIVLYHQQGLSYQEISDITDEPLSKVKNRIFRARKMMKESLLTI